MIVIVEVMLLQSESDRTPLGVPFRQFVRLIYRVKLYRTMSTIRECDVWTNTGVNNFPPPTAALFLHVISRITDCDAASAVLGHAP